MKFTVKGMTCGHCVGAITRAIEAIGASAHVDLESRTVRVDGTRDAAVVRRAIEAEGYTVVAVDPT